MGSTPEGRGQWLYCHLERCCVSLRSEKFELDLLQHISSWELCKLTARTVCARRVKTFALSSAAMGTCIFYIHYTEWVVYKMSRTNDWMGPPFYLVSIKSRNITIWAYPADKNLFLVFSFDGINSAWKYFSAVFLFLKKNRMHGLLNSWAVTPNKGRTRSFPLRLRGIHFSFWIIV